MYENALLVGDFDRRQVLLLGDYPIDLEPLLERGLSPMKVTLENAVQKFPYSKALIIADYPSKFALAKGFFEQLSSAARNYGLAVKVLAHTDSDFLQLRSLIPPSANNPVYFISKIREVAESIARYSPGPPKEEVKIEPMDLKLDQEIVLLLQRSFFGCDKIHLTAIGGGKASLGLYKVYAWMKNSEVGPLPLPFFAKIAKHGEIDKELRNYRVYTDLYIPFRFRPNCRIERCVKTENYASLVGNFVDDAIPLRKALQEAHSSGIIFSLFERSLRGFRVQPVVAKKEPMIGGLQSFIEEKIKIDFLLGRTDVVSEAKNLGFKSDIQSLYDKLIEACPAACLMGPYHGDLNSRNIMVKGEDAILIDFCSIGHSGPLTADPATIEISLSFELDDKNFPDFTKWKEFINEAYNPATLTKPLALTEVIPNEFTWLRRAIRETRHVLIGCDCCHEEIKVVIATCLLRIARLAPKELIEEKEKAEFEYRAYALVVAERIIDSLTDHQ